MVGWQFVLAKDESFLYNSAENQLRTDCLENTARKTEQDELQDQFVGLKIDFLSEILKITDLNYRWKYVKNLTSLQNAELLHDSFSSIEEDGTLLALKECLNGKRVNIVILGAGCAGLFLANALKLKLGEAVNILVCEKRAYRPGVKKPYSRNWLTNILISCKNSGVNFYFNPELDTKFIEGTNSHLIVDATGGNVDHLYSQNTAPKELTVSIK